MNESYNIRLLAFENPMVVESMQEAMKAAKSPQGARPVAARRASQRSQGVNTDLGRLPLFQDANQGERCIDRPSAGHAAVDRNCLRSALSGLGAPWQ